MPPKILIIPSWYPNDANRSRGIFFWEQALLTASRFDVRMLVGAEVGVGKRKFYKYFLPFTGKVDPFYQQQCAALRTDYFEYILPTFLSESAQRKILLQAYLKKVQELIRGGWRPQLIHAHSALYGGLAAEYISERIQVPYIITEHQHFIFDYFPNNTFRLAKTALEKAAQVLSVSKFQSRMMLMNDVQCSPQVIGNFVDETVFCPQQKPAAARPFTILTVGYHTHLKDMKTFFKALAALNNSGFQNYRAVVISPKYNGAHIDYVAYAKQCGVFQKCSFIEELDRSDMAACFQKCDVFVSTAVAETFGLSIAEALMCGKPVVVTDSGGIHDFVNDGVNGFICDVGDFQSVAKNIMRVHAGNLGQTPEAIRSVVIEKYGRTAFLQKLTHAYHQLIQPNTIIANTVS